MPLGTCFTGGGSDWQATVTVESADIPVPGGCSLDHERIPLRCPGLPGSNDQPAGAEALSYVTLVLTAHHLQLC